MEFRIADTFTDSLARLNTEEQKAAKITALDLQLNPAHPSLQFHKLEKAREKQFWSVRVNSERTSHPHLALVFVRLVVKKLDLGFRSNGGVNLFLPRDALPPPFRVELFAACGPFLVRFAWDLPLFPRLLQFMVQVLA